MTKTADQMRASRFGGVVSGISHSVETRLSIVMSARQWWRFKRRYATRCVGREVDRLLDRYEGIIENLQGADDAFPKTANGVPIRAGMVITDSNGDDWPIDCVVHEKGEVLPQFDGDERPEHWNNGDGTHSYVLPHCRWWVCYYPRDAAPIKEKDL